jgi:sugar phosphate isomerase/epimerase
MSWPQKLSLNLQTTLPRGLEASLEACVAAGVPAIGVYGPPHIEPIGLARAVELVRAANIPVKIHASVGCWAAGADALGRPRDLRGNIALLDEAVALGAEMVGVSGGGLPAGERDIRGARQRIADGLQELLPYVRERNLKLAIEPVHPIYGPERAVLHTLHQALDLVEATGDRAVGVVVDTYHQWWEPDLLEQLQRGVSSGRIFLVQVSDWSPAGARAKPFSRVPMGEGCIDFELFAQGLRGYDGWFDMEVLGDDRLAALPLADLLDLLAASFLGTLGPLVLEEVANRVGN